MYSSQFRSHHIEDDIYVAQKHWNSFNSPLLHLTSSSLIYIISNLQGIKPIRNVFIFSRSEYEGCFIHLKINPEVLTWTK
jgi:hypothetical protein